MADPLVLATVLALKIAGGNWIAPPNFSEDICNKLEPDFRTAQENSVCGNLHDIDLVSSAVWWEARNKGLAAKTQIAYSVLDRGSFHSTSASIPETLSRKDQFPWFTDRRIKDREARTSKFSIEQQAWEEAVMVATLVYASDEKTPLLKRPCNSNPTMFDAEWNLKKRIKERGNSKEAKRLSGILKHGCHVDGIVFWNEQYAK